MPEPPSDGPCSCLYTDANEEAQSEMPEPMDFETLRPRLRAYALKLTGHREAAVDLVQDTLLKAWAARSRFTPGTCFDAWMCTILKHRFLDQCRTERTGRVAGDPEAFNISSAASQDSAVRLDETAQAF